MKKKGFFDKLADRLDGDDDRIANYGGYDVKLGSKADDDDDKPDTEFKKEEILKLVEDYQKKDDSISIELAKLVGNNKISARAQELVLDGKIDLKVFLSDIIKADKAGTAQQIIDGLATKPEPKPEPRPEPKPEPKPEPAPVDNPPMVVPQPYDVDQRAAEIIYEMREHPGLAKILLDPKTDTKPRKGYVYMLRFDPSDLGPIPKKKKPLTKEQADEIICNRYGGDPDVACGPNGCLDREERVLDRKGRVTEEIFPESPKKG